MRILIAILFLLPIMGSAENYFKKGMKWEYEAQGCGPYHNHERFAYALEGDTIVDGFDASRLYLYSGDVATSKKFLAFIRTEGDKVFFKYDYPDEEWSLIYDFGLSPNDECFVDRITTVGDDRTHYSDWVKCESVGKSTYYSGFPVLIMGDEWSFSGVGQFGEWLVGVGHPWIFSAGGMFSVTGDASCLIRATYNGEVICEYNTDKIESVEEPEEPVVIYSLDGLVVYQGLVSKENLNDMISNSGIYIVKTGKCVEKITVAK